MLLQRSILSKVCILLVICLVKAQYENEGDEKKEVKEGEEHDHDYAKIFADETSAALTAATADEDSPKQSGYVNPAEFESYFTPAHIFGESNDEPTKVSPENKKKEPLHTYESKRDDYPSYLDSPLKDFFDDSEKKQHKLQKEQSSKDEEVVPPGPSYVSHQIIPSAPFTYVYDEEADRSASASEERKNEQQGSQQADIEEGRVEKNADDYALPVPFTFVFKSNKPKVDYDTGKSSSTVSQYPAASGYTKPAVSTPYQKQASNSYETEVRGPLTFEKQESSPYEKKTSTPYNKEESRSYEKQAISPYHEPESSPYEKKYDDEIDSSFEKQESSPYEKKTSSPYEKQESSEYDKEVSSPYEKQESSPYEKKTSSPYEKQESSPYEKKTSSPYEKHESNEYDKEVSSPYEKQESSPYEQQANTPNPYEKDASLPYAKFTYEPSEDYVAKHSKYFGNVVNPVKPYNPPYEKNSEKKYEPQSTENAPAKPAEAVKAEEAAQGGQGKGCRKVPSDKDDMNCFICENPKTNAKYTQCSFSSQQKPVDYYEGNSAKYTMAQKPGANSYRYKRNAPNEETDPYTYIRNRARKASSEKSSGIPADYSAGFQYQPEHYDETKSPLTYSEQHSQEIKKNPDNCKKVEKDGMTCTICKDPKSGGNFEQCSYASKPKEKKFAYVTEKKFENDEPTENQPTSEAKGAESNEKDKSGAASQKNTEYHDQYQSGNDEQAPKKGTDEEIQAKSSENKENKEGSSYEYPSYFVKNLDSPGYDDIYKGSSSDVDSKKKDYFSDFDEYHFKYFPEFTKQEAKQESKQESRQEPAPENYEVPIPQATKQNVESVLAEFTKKDRSNCKRAEKKGMTCFLCVDKNNIQNEECMYVQESKPENKHVAYHEAQATEKAAVPEPAPVQTEAPKQELKVEPAVTETKNKYFFKNAAPAPPLGLEAAASDTISTFVRYDPDRAKRNVNKKKEQEEAPKEQKPDESAYESERIDDKADPTIKTPEEFNVAPGEGAFSEETKAIYSKELGVQLPKYMLEKSEFEKEFDAFSGAF